MPYNKRMTEEEKQIEQEAVRWIRRVANKRLIVEQFASPDTYKASESSIIIFTAGSPGAGKTEFIKAFRKPMERLFDVQLAVIDPDAVRDLLPGYTGSNSYLFQRPVSIAVDDLFRHVLKQQQSAFVDGTLSDYERAHQNVQAVIDRYGIVMVCYVFQHVAIAWRFTQLREAVEGRNIQKADFINKFLGAKETVNRLKSDFGDNLILHVILKDYKDTEQNKAVAEVFDNVASIEQCLDFDYTKDSIERILEL